MDDFFRDLSSKADEYLGFVNLPDISHFFPWLHHWKYAINGRMPCASAMLLVILAFCGLPLSMLLTPSFPQSLPCFAFSIMALAMWLVTYHHGIMENHCGLRFLHHTGFSIGLLPCGQSFAWFDPAIRPLGSNPEGFSGNVTAPAQVYSVWKSLALCLQGVRQRQGALNMKSSGYLLSIGLLGPASVHHLNPDHYLKSCLQG